MLISSHAAPHQSYKQIYQLIFLSTSIWFCMSAGQLVWGGKKKTVPDLQFYESQ